MIFCDNCNGSGVVWDEDCIGDSCSDCNGKGFMNGTDGMTKKKRKRSRASQISYNHVSVRFRKEYDLQRFVYYKI